MAIGVLLFASGCDGSSSGDDDNSSSGGSEPRPLVSIVSQRLQPSAAGAGIDTEARVADYHYIAQPEQAAERKDVLVVFLGGSASSPADYIDIASFAARLGYAVIDLSYLNDEVVGSNRTCAGDDACFTRLRGESLFGQGNAYAPGERTYDSDEIETDKANSIVNRIVSALDFLASQPQSATNPSPDGYWTQFLTADEQSPYVGMSTGNAYPDWDKIIIAGHSQGAGHAAFLPLHLPADTAVRRVVMFSGPNDHVGQRSADWIGDASQTPLDRFWGLRNADEGILGDFTATNWQNLGGPGSGGVGGTAASGDRRIGAGSGDPRGSHRLVITAPDDNALRNHESTAVDEAHTDAVEPAWRYLFTGGGAD